MSQIVLITGVQMPKPDLESELVVQALAERGLAAEVLVWGAEHDWASATLVVCRTPWDYCSRLDEFLAWAAGVDQATHLENPIDLLRWNSHKRYLLDLQRAGVPIVPTAMVRRHADVHQQRSAIESMGSYDLVVKPAVSSGARGALRGPPDAVAGHLGRLVMEGDALVQPFVEAVQQHGEISIICFNGQFSHAVLKVPAAGEYRVQEHHGGTAIIWEPTPEQLALAHATVAAAPVAPLYGRLDLVQTEAGPLLMEAEFIEPELFLRLDSGAAGRLADRLAACL